MAQHEQGHIVYRLTFQAEYKRRAQLCGRNARAACYGLLEAAHKARPQADVRRWCAHELRHLYRQHMRREAWQARQAGAYTGKLPQASRGA